MSTRVMPLVVINLGSEMMYVLEQRLHAQQLTATRANQISAAIISTLVNPEFLEHFFQPQEMYGRVPLLAVLGKLCQSANIQLTEASMGKLYDLILMGFKRQTMGVLLPSHLLAVTHNHLDSLKAMVKHSAATVQLVTNAATMIDQAYSKLSEGEWMFIRQTFLCFLQCKHEKIAIFMDQGLQNQDGRFVVKISGAVPPGSVVPGVITQYDATGNKSTFFNYGDICEDSAPTINSSQPVTDLGMNVYNQNVTKTSSLHTTFGQHAPDLSRDHIEDPTWDSVRNESVREQQQQQQQHQQQQHQQRQHQQQQQQQLQQQQQPTPQGNPPNYINDDDEHKVSLPPNYESNPTSSSNVVQTAQTNQGLALLSRLIGVSHAKQHDNFQLTLSFDNHPLPRQSGPHSQTQLQHSNDQHKKSAKATNPKHDVTHGGHRQSNILQQLASDFEMVGRVSNTRSHRNHDDGHDNDDDDDDEDDLLGLLDAAS